MSNFRWTKFRNEIPNIRISKLSWNRTHSPLSTLPCWGDLFFGIYKYAWVSEDPYRGIWICNACLRINRPSLILRISVSSSYLFYHFVPCAGVSLLNYCSLNVSLLIRHIPCLFTIALLDVRPNILFLYSWNLLLFIKCCLSLTYSVTVRCIMNNTIIRMFWVKKYFDYSDQDYSRGWLYEKLLV